MPRWRLPKRFKSPPGPPKRHASFLLASLIAEPIIAGTSREEVLHPTHPLAWKVHASKGCRLRPEIRAMEAITWVLPKTPRVQETKWIGWREARARLSLRLPSSDFLQPPRGRCRKRCSPPTAERLPPSLAERNACWTPSPDRARPPLPEANAGKVRRTDELPAGRSLPPPLTGPREKMSAGSTRAALPRRPAPPHTHIHTSQPLFFSPSGFNHGIHAHCPSPPGKAARAGQRLPPACSGTLNGRVLRGRRGGDGGVGWGGEGRAFEGVPSSVA